MSEPAKAGAQPAGIPDAATLAGLANEFFRALPGIVPAPSTSGASPMQPAPPQAVAMPINPYYFIAESSAYPSAAGAALDRIGALTFEIPDQPALHQLPGRLPTDERGDWNVLSTPARDPAFYFLESAKPPGFSATPAPTLDAHPAFDVHSVRRDFPILAEQVNGRPLIWFDNAATTQKPQGVIDRLAHFYAHENSNIHRAAHELAARATDAYESARSKVARFLGAGSSDEIVFVRGATEAINLVAFSWGRANLRPGDEIVLSHLEHHANIVPWQLIAQQQGAVLRVIPVDDSGQLLLEDYTRLLNERTKLVSVSHVSNALGTITPVAQIIEQAHRVGARVLIDGAQAVAHMRVNVQALDADFYAFSGHKLFAPTGIGVLYGKKELLNVMPPWQGGGNMIQDVTFEHTSYQSAPARFEAGTGNIADAAGLGAAIDYLERLGLEAVGRYEHDLLCYAIECLRAIPGLRLIGTATDKASVQSFVLEGYRPEDVGSALNREGIAVRAGHHCAQPILRRFGVESTVRPSFAFYNTYGEIDALIRVLQGLAAQFTRSRR